MRGLKIIPLFMGLMVLVYLGMRFVDANRSPVSVMFFGREAPQTPLGFVVLTSALVGMLACGLLCTVEILALHFKNRKLRIKIAQLAQMQKTVKPERPAPELEVPTLTKTEGV